VYPRPGDSSLHGSPISPVFEAPLAGVPSNTEPHVLTLGNGRLS
jgi:hypothetical protein